MARIAFLVCFALLLAGPAGGTGYVEPPVLAEQVGAGTLPPVAKRLPSTPLVVPLDGPGERIGRHGGTIRMLMAQDKDVRMMVVYGYARLVGYNADFEIVPDILERVDVVEGREFTLHLRKGHRWSDGHPFTAEDFRYYWQDVATHEVVSPTGPPWQLLVEGERPRFEVLNDTTVRYAWSKPNPYFLPALAGALPLYIYRPAHYLKQFHAAHQDPATLKALVEKKKQRNWRALHFRYDQQYKNEDPDLPTLDPWVNATSGPAPRYVFKRNPFFHRVDAEGRQLPYADEVTFIIASAGLIPAKTGSGEADLQARYLAFNNYTFLKQGAARNGYDVHLWQTAKGSHMALFPNLNAEDWGLRQLFCEGDFRRALSLAVHRREINQVIYFGLALPHANTVLPRSPLYRDAYGKAWTGFDLAEANRLLDGLGLVRRPGDGLRLMPDGRPIEFIVETAGEEIEQTDVLQLVQDSWLQIGVKIHIKALQREVLRNRIFAGHTAMAVWSGLENGIANAGHSPDELAPVSQQQLQWPKWGQYYESKGSAGAPPDLAPARRLLALNAAWRDAADRAERERIWHEMLAIHAEEVYSIGLISGVLQPVVVNRRLRNVPDKAVFNFEPGAFFGVYRPDTFWFDRAEVAAAPGGAPAAQ